MKKILIVNANYYNDITKKLVNSAKKTLNNKFKIYVINVPGVFEIPIVIKKNIKKFDAFLAIGCVIKGKTPHFELICETSFNAIMNLMVKYNKPIGNGIITSFNKKQALERSGNYKSKKPNKGFEAAKAVLSITSNVSKKI